MEPRRTSAELPLPLAGALLLIFLAGGLGTGTLARGFVNSLRPEPTGTARPAITATTTRVARQVIPTPGTPTPIPTQAGPDQPFLLQITANPSHVSAGATIKVTIVATTKVGDKKVAGLSCALGAPRTGPPALLDTWPATQTTDAAGTTSWTLTIPGSQAGGTYGVEVSAAGTNNYSFWSYAVVYVA
jgi:hypothetical protein